MVLLPGSMLLTSNLHHLRHQMSPGSWKRLIILLSCVFGGGGTSLQNKNPHQPMTLTWQVLSQTGDVVWDTKAVQPPWTWWPTLKPDVCALAASLESWDIPGTDVSSSKRVRPPDSDYTAAYKQITWGAIGCSYPRARTRMASSTFYVCPRDGRTLSEARRCGGLESLYCKEWDCETTGTGYWLSKSSKDLITVKWDQNSEWTQKFQQCHQTGWCNPLKIDFTDKGKLSKDWITGKTWGLRFYVSGHPGVQFTIRLKITNMPAVAVGPDLVLVEQGPPRTSLALPPPLPPREAPPPSLPDSNSTALATSAQTPTVRKTIVTLNTPPPTTGDRLFDLVQGAFLTLNATNPGATESCWLCLAMGPPYYEAIASSGEVAYSTDLDRCRWGTQGKLTLTEVSGHGLCIGKVPFTHQHLCNQTLSINSSGDHQYLLPSNHSWWACSTGLTPCLSTSVFNQTRDFCIQVQLIPRIYYYPEEVLLQAYDNSHPRTKREAVSLTLAVLLGLGITAGIGTGSTALIKGPIDLQQGLTSLQIAIDADLRALQDSVSKLEDSLTSLSEVVLQNRRGLDLLFLKEGGLCAALKEECCFYIDHSGAVRDSMKKLKEKLDKRQLERQKSQNWYEGWFNNSPWFTTLLSTIAGPLLLLLLLLILGPCIINKLVQFINDRISAVKILVLRQKYQALENEGNL
uniref:Envelope glycoprotein n=2 Tax=Gibbon ape leukemia virus TaxID=11840 RepID=ENV_GALV|nr:RecName: Full=Envelope glycoprotein; AltName: Full=Env polyprotein; Contains: RecName: Full=Surface protein; Short=SU; AltName: Full=Glycoprotein 70; Short=gp70; Contains: RecName: Full=Transmembrane protein; Short=TM; AltName: Full=Envelope protein p15E; Contains: RecName: Full=R-peptide; AltName: Full=p2E; Flags: Precursor [Gibbon ape leukemia virus]AAC96083.1 envelope protein [Gibbon ape leukemia virus]ALV83304.1 envelope protein [Gibbon ape leukemia virus]